MKIKPKEVLINVPVVLLFTSEDEAARFASGINTIIHGKVKLKYDNLGVLNTQEVVIFYLQRNDEYHHLRNQFIQMIEQEEMGILPTQNDDEEIPQEKQNSFFLTKEQMVKLTTERLLAYKKMLLSSYHDGPDWDSNDNDSMHKGRPEWQEAYKSVKEILATREHIEK